MLCLLCCTTFGWGQSDDLLKRKYTYSFAVGLTTNYPIGKGKYWVLVRGMKNFSVFENKYHPFNQIFSYKFGIENKNYKVELGYFKFSNDNVRKAQSGKLFSQTAQGLELNFSSKRLRYSWSRKLYIEPMLSYAIDVGLGYVNQRFLEGTNKHRYGLGAHLKYHFYPNLYIQNTTSVSYHSHGLPTYLLSQFYIGIHF